MLEKIAKYLIWAGLIVILFVPLYLNTHLFFPFIVTKTLAFNIAIEVMFLAWLFLVFRDNNYKIKLNLAVVLFAVYLIVIFLSSLLGDNFYRSFWSNNERSEGILLLLHLFVFLLVITNFFRQFKSWLIIFDIFLAASLLVSLYAIGQFFHLSWIPASSGGVRLAGTIGNAGYMAGYLIFGIYVAFILAFNRPEQYLKFYYISAIILEIFIVFNTYTRGGILALLLTGFLFSLYLLFYYFKNKYLKLIGVGVIILAIILPVLLVKNKNTEFVNDHQILARIASISGQSNTSQTRLMTWHSAWLGFKDRPILGWGYENFYQPFDKYFNPLMYDDAGSVVWFDRAHNIIFDRLLTGGIVGLVAYLALLFVPFYYLWLYYYKKEDKNSYFIPVVFSLIILAYFIQNLFIFEALVTYIPLFLTIGFVSLFSPNYNFDFLKNDKFKFSLVLIYLILFLPIIYFVTIKPYQANTALVQALSRPDISINQRINTFKYLIGKNTNGNPEYRQQLVNFLNNLAINSQSVDQKYLVDLANFTELEVNRQIKDNSYSVTGYLLLMRFNNFMFNASANPKYIEQNLQIAEIMKKLAPNRQHVYFEIGYTYFGLANHYKKINDEKNLQDSFGMAVSQFEKAMSLNEKSPESYKQLAIILAFGGVKDRAIEMAQKASLLNKNYVEWSDGFVTSLKAATDK